MNFQFPEGDKSQNFSFFILRYIEFHCSHFYFIIPLFYPIWFYFYDIFSFYFFLLLIDLIRAEGNSSSLPINQETTFITGPYLDGTGITNVTTQISTHAYLPCKVSSPFFLLIKLITFSIERPSEWGYWKIHRVNKDLYIHFSFFLIGYIHIFIYFLDYFSLPISSEIKSSSVEMKKLRKLWIYS